MACTKSGKVVGWQLMPAAFDESQAIPCVMHGVDSQKEQASSKPQSSGTLNGFSQRSEVQVPSSATKSVAEARSSSTSTDPGKSGRLSKGLPPATSVSRDSHRILAGSTRSQLQNGVFEDTSIRNTRAVLGENMQASVSRAGRIA